jgi:hypothetical protein
VDDDAWDTSTSIPARPMSHNPVSASSELEFEAAASSDELALLAVCDRERRARHSVLG